MHNLEIFEEAPVHDAVAERFGLVEGLYPASPHFDLEREIAVQRFLGYDAFHVYLPGMKFSVKRDVIQGTTGDGQQRVWAEEHEGPIQN